MHALEARTFSIQCVKNMNIGSSFSKLQTIKQATVFDTWGSSFTADVHAVLQMTLIIVIARLESCNQSKLVAARCV